MIIYKIQNKTNGKIYIGQTVRTLEERMAEHLRHKKTAIDSALAHGNKNNFKVDIIDNANSIEELNQKEIFWIKYYDSIAPKGYNLCDGGDNTMGYHHKEKSKKAMSIAKKKMYIGEGNPFYGKTHSYEQRKKWSAERSGRKLSKEWKEKISNSSAFKRKIINLDTLEIFDSIVEAAKKYNIVATHITRVCRKKRKTTGGYHWMYYDEYMTIPCQTKEEIL